MALNAYLSLTGAKQGQIGSFEIKGRSNLIPVFAMHHELASIIFTEANGGQTVKPKHKPLTITKQVDKSSLFMLKAMVTSELLTEVILRFYVPSATGDGSEFQNYTIKLSNALITSIVEDMANNKIESGKDLPVLETVSFTYQKIDWTWMQSGISVIDKWA